MVSDVCPCQFNHLKSSAEDVMCEIFGQCLHYSETSDICTPLSPLLSPPVFLGSI